MELSWKTDCLWFSLSSIFISLWTDLEFCLEECKQEEGFVSMTSCLSTKWLGFSLGITRFVLHTKLATDTGLTRFWWLVLVLPELLLRISNPPPPWIWERLRTKGGVLPELEEQLMLFWAAWKRKNHILIIIIWSWYYF